MRKYGKFYWPLALTSVVLLLESQFQNAVLARYPNATLELATFAMANSSFQLVNALLVFIPQMVTVLGRTTADRLLCRNFAHAAGAAMSLPLLLMGFSELGQRFIGGAMNIPPAALPSVVRYLQWLAPLVWVNAVRHYCTGVLVLAERTRTVTVLNLIHLATLVTVLLGGRAAGLGALPTLALATISANVIHLCLAMQTTRGVGIPKHHRDARASATWTSLLHFFWPLATTSAMFAMSRPVLYAFINLTPQALVSIAALRVAFDFGAIFQNCTNQFRHVYATYGSSDPDGVARFMFKVTGLLTLVMVLTIFGPLCQLIFGRLLGLTGDTLHASLQAVRIFCLVPLVITLRNLYHGRMMVGRRTGGMALAAMLRVLTMGLAAKIMLELGWLNHVSGAIILLLGFVMETAMAKFAADRAGRQPPRHFTEVPPPKPQPTAS